MTVVFDAMQSALVALDVLASSQATRQVVAARAKLRLTKLLQTASRGSRLYSERLHGFTSGHSCWETVPKVNKEELMQRFADWVTDPQIRLDELRAFAADPRRIAQPFLGKYMVWESSGSSGQPGLFVQDAACMATYDALEALRRSPPAPGRRGLDPLYLAERVAFVGATNGHFASVVSMQRLRQINPWMEQAIQSFSILQPAASLVRELNDYAPSVIVCYPTVAALLAAEAVRGTLSFKPLEIWTGGESLEPGVRHYIQHSLCPTVRNSYGASEFLSIAWECHHGHLHANTDWVLLEPVDDRGRPVPAGEQSHSTLLTNLANAVQPLIRYDLGDQITVRQQVCACGSPFPWIEVSGRCDECLGLQRPDGQIVTLLPLALTTVLETQAELFDFQLFQRNPSTLELRIPQTGQAAVAVLQRGRKALREYCANQGLRSLRIIGKLGEGPLRGRSGKLPRVVAWPPQRSRCPGS